VVIIGAVGIASDLIARIDAALYYEMHDVLMGDQHHIHRGVRGA